MFIILVWFLKIIILLWLMHFLCIFFQFTNITLSYNSIRGQCLNRICSYFFTLFLISNARILHNTRYDLFLHSTPRNDSTIWSLCIVTFIPIPQLASVLDQNIYIICAIRVIWTVNVLGCLLIILSLTVNTRSNK